MAVLQSFISSAVPSKHFSYKDGAFVCEASDLKGIWNGDKQIYDDACDVGIAIRSARTGAVVKFYHAETFKDREGDVTHWEYHSTADHARHLLGLKVIIFND
jgi:hypothetical protein